MDIEKLVKRIADRGLSLRVLAKKIEVSETTLQRVNKGKDLNKSTLTAIESGLDRIDTEYINTYCEHLATQSIIDCCSCKNSDR